MLSWLLFLRPLLLALLASVVRFRALSARPPARSLVRCSLRRSRRSFLVALLASLALRRVAAASRALCVRCRVVRGLFPSLFPSPRSSRSARSPLPRGRRRGGLLPRGRLLLLLPCLLARFLFGRGCCSGCFFCSRLCCRARFGRGFGRFLRLSLCCAPVRGCGSCRSVALCCRLCGLCLWS